MSRSRGGRAETGDCCDGFRSAAAAPLLAAAKQERGQVDAVTNDECADALRAAELVCGDRHQVDAEIAEAQGNSSGGLYCIRVDAEAAIACEFSSFCNGLNDAGLAQGKYSLAGGGRYDYLVESMGGKPSSAVGLAIGLERTASKMRDRHYPLPGAEDNLVFIAQLSDAAKLKSLQLFDELRQAGFKIRQSFSTDSLKTQMEEAVRVKAKISLIMGKKEVMDETILMRDMDSTVQEIVPVKKIKEKLAKKIDLGNNESKLINVIKHI